MEPKLLIDSIIREAAKQVNKPLDIKGCLRTPYAQAEAMYPLFESNSPLLQRYAFYKQEMLREIQVAYKSGKDMQKDKRAIIYYMSSVIQKQVDNNKFISNSLSNAARDIQTANLTMDETYRLLNYLKSRNDLFVMNETRTALPHIHIHMK